MEITEKDFQIIQKTGVDEYLVLHPETTAENVRLNVDGIEAVNVGDAIIEVNENLKSIGAQLIEVGVDEQATPSSNLAIGGLFFKQI